MDIKKLILQVQLEEQKKLATAKTAQELSEIAREMGHPLDVEEAEAVFAALYPVRGKEPLSEEELAAVSAGFRPLSTGREYINGRPVWSDESKENAGNADKRL